VANFSTWGVTTKLQVDEILRKKVKNGKVKFYDVFEEKTEEVKLEEFVNFKLEPFGFKLILIF